MTDELAARRGITLILGARAYVVTYTVLRRAAYRGPIGRVALRALLARRRRRRFRLLGP